MHLHLAVIQPNVGECQEPTQASRLFSPRTHDFAWNDTFTAFRPLKLTWWDDASYIAYQASDMGSERDGEEEEELPPTKRYSDSEPPTFRVPPSVREEITEDDIIPF